MSLNELRGNVFKPEVIKGADGKSAYEIACEHGFQGTEQEWLESMSPKTSVIPVFLYDSYNLVEDIYRDLDITSHITFVNTQMDEVYRQIISQPDHSNMNVVFYTGPSYVSVPTNDSQYDRVETAFSIQPQGQFNYVTVVVIFADGSCEETPIPTGMGHEFPLTSDIKLIVIVVG